MWSHLLRGDIKSDGAHIHIDKAVSARQDEEKTCVRQHTNTAKYLRNIAAADTNNNQ